MSQVKRGSEPTLVQQSFNETTISIYVCMWSKKICEWKKKFLKNNEKYFHAHVWYQDEFYLLFLTFWWIKTNSPSYQMESTRHWEDNPESGNYNSHQQCQPPNVRSNCSNRFHDGKTHPDPIQHRDCVLGKKTPSHTWTTLWFLDTKYLYLQLGSPMAYKDDKQQRFLILKMKKN